jgi:superoxide dismutase, Fe-Mn family
MGEKKRSTSPRQFAATAITRRKLREGTGVTGGPRTLSAPAAAGEAHAPPPDEPSTITRPGTGRRGAAAMAQEIAPIAVRPSMLSGISEQSVVSHYEHIYGTAVRRLNAVRRELAALDAGVAPHVVRGLKGQEISLMGSVALHELYFGNLGGFRRAGPNSGLGRPDWHEVPDTFAAEIAADFGSTNAWRREFAAMAQSLAGDAGWVLLTYARRQKRFLNHIATDHTQATVDAAPVLVLDMYEHAYEMDYGANATAYIDSFFKNINWDAVLKRIDAARNHRPPPNEDPSSTRDIPSLSVEELAAQIAKGSGVQIVDARQRDHMSRDPDLMAGATWRDPDRVEEWVAELIQDKPVAVYCSYGFDVGCNVAKTLTEHGLNARFVRGGLSAWYASGGARALKPAAG